MIFILSLVYFVILLFVFFKIQSNNIRLVFLAGGLLTLGLSLLALVFNLPFSGADAATFEGIAWLWSRGSFADVLSTFDVSRSYVISSITAVFYYFAGREPFIPIIINSFLGLFIMFFSLKLFDEVWGKNGNRKLLFFILVVFSPMLTINSSIILRENYITLFLLVATLHLARFANSGSFVSAALFVLFTILSSFFHGGTILYLLGLPMYLFFGKGTMGYGAKAVWMVVFFIALAFILNYMEFGKLQEIQETGISAEGLAERLSGAQEANTTYLQGMVPSNTFDLLWQTPIRALFFLTKPFIWDIRAFGHAISFLDALIWIFIIVTIYKNRTVIYNNPAALAILFGCIVAIFAFAYGTSNYGTAIRHRTKFYVEMLVLAAPFFTGFKFKRSKR